MKDIVTTLQDIKSVVDNTLADFQKEYPTYISKVKSFGEKLKEKGLNKNNAYLFVKGHKLFDNLQGLFYVCFH